MSGLHSLNPQQREAAETIHGPVLILAGAGTGKTRVITHRIAQMIRRGVAPGSILAVTFTNKAAKEMQERVRELIPKTRQTGDTPAEKPTVCTFHSLCVRILRQHIERLGYKRNFVIYSEGDQLSVVKKVLGRFTSQSEKLDASAMLSLLSKFKNKGPSALRGSDPNLAALAEIVLRHYETSLRACNAVDFDDLILLVLRLFKEHSEALEACRAQYQYLMVDEYQDTNFSQFELVRFIADKHRNLCVVGDDDQSIYGWRGAEIANLLELEKYFPEVKVIKLEQNYRSTNTILQAANAVIKNNPRRRGKKLWSESGNGAPITLHTFPDDTEEARTLAEEIEFKRVAGRVPWREQAILFRTNIQSKPIETALRKANIRYHLIGGQSFFDRREVKDFVAWLKTLLNPEDDISLLRVANIPARGLSELTMERLVTASQKRKCPVYEALGNPLVQAEFVPKTQEAIASFKRLIDSTREPLLKAKTLNLKSWLEGFLAQIGYMEDLRRSEKDPETAENRIRNIQELLSDLGRAAESPAPPTERLNEFLDGVSLDNNWGEDKEPTSDAVTLITMHSCKGLEYPHVYIVGLEDGILPHTRSKVEGTLDEERRLFYVAITRARISLTLSHCQTRRKYGERISCRPSPFLLEIPKELTESAAERDKKAVTPEAGKNLFASIRDSLR